MKAVVLLACLLVAIGAGALGFLMLLDHVEHLWLFLLVPALFLLGAVPILIRLARGQFDLFEVLIPYWAMYFLFYGAGALFVLSVPGAQFETGVVDYPDIALAYLTLGFACALVGYALAGRIVSPALDGPGISPGLFVLTGLYTIGLMGAIVSSSIGFSALPGVIQVSGVQSLLSQLTFLSTFALFYVYFLCFSRQALLRHKVLLLAYMLPTQLLVMVAHFGNKTVVMWALGLPIVAYWYARRRIPVKSVLAALFLVVFVLFPVYYSYRTVKGLYYSKEYRIQRSIEILRKQEVSEYAQGSLETVARRLAIINSTAVIIKDCGTRVDYQYGKTLWLGVISVAIPRLIWPDKPLINIGITFGRTFRLTGFMDFSFVSQSMVGELYWNLHLPGIIVGMALMGFWLRSMYQRFGANQGANPLRLSMYVVLMYLSVTNAEAEIGGLSAGLFKTTIVLLLIEKLLALAYQGRTGESPRPAAPEFAG